jgi:hypothetical protein
LPDSSANSVAERDWDAIAHDYAASAQTVPEICALHSVSPAALYERAKLDGWIKRSVARRATANGASSVTIESGRGSNSLSSPILATQTGVHPAGKRSSPRPSPPTSKAALVRRMLTALDRKMTAFETRMTLAGTVPATAADSERDARTLNTLVRLFDKLKGFRTKAATSAGAAAKSRAGGKDIHDADRFRNDLARRLERLRDSIGG